MRFHSYRNFSIITIIFSSYTIINKGSYLAIITSFYFNFSINYLIFYIE